MPFFLNVASSPLLISILVYWRDKVRPASFDIRLNYEEMVDSCFYANPKKWALRYAPRLAGRHLMNMRTKGNALAIGLLKGCLDKGIDIWLEAPAQRLIQDDGAVVGLEVERAGETGERPAGAIGIQTLRGGDNPGEHTVYFAGAGERVELAHRSSTRDHFARGAVQAAAWLIGKPPGLYPIETVYGLD